ncbi:MAG: hypothetical protein ABSD71_12105 [Bacteroidales bacterium]
MRPFKSYTFGGIHIRVSNGIPKAMPQKFFFRHELLAKFTFWQSVKFLTRQVIRTNTVLLDLADAFENIYRKVKSAIFTTVFHGSPVL